LLLRTWLMCWRGVVADGCDEETRVGWCVRVSEECVRAFVSYKIANFKHTKIPKSKASSLALPTLPPLPVESLIHSPHKPQLPTNHALLSLLSRPQSLGLSPKINNRPPAPAHRRPRHGSSSQSQRSRIHLHGDYESAWYCDSQEFCGE
jgi:hypothetical protein